MSITKCFNRGGAETHSYERGLALRAQTAWRGRFARVIAVVLAAACAPFAASAGSATLVCTGYAGTETLTDFQALIKLDEGRYGFSYADCADQAAGTDVWFSDAEGTVLQREIDMWNPAGSSFIWVKIPSLSWGTKITMHWGDASKAQSAANTAVWTGFAGVWHMGKATKSESEPDMTGHGLDAEARENGKTSKIDLMVAVKDGGLVGGSRTNSTNRANDNALHVPSFKEELDDFNTFTVGGWFWQTVSANVTRFFSSRAGTQAAGAYNGWEMTSAYTDDNGKPSGVNDNDYHNYYVARVSAGKNSTFSVFPATSRVEKVIGRWVYYCGVFKGTSVKAYADGVLVNEGEITDELPTANDNGFWMGRYGDRGNTFIGKYDEVRLYNGAMSADRVKADYDTVKTPAEFFTQPAPKSATLECTGYTGSETLTDFQALIKLEEGSYGFSYAECADQKEGKDIWFSTDRAGNDKLAREIDTWNPGGSSFIWVKIPSLAKGTKITMHWGDASEAQPAANPAVWTGFAGVWHMGKATKSESEPDMTGHGLDAKPTETTGTNSRDLNQMVPAEGKVGKSRINANTGVSGGYCQGLKVPDYTGKISNQGVFTVCGWFYASDTPGNSRMFCTRPVTSSPDDQTGLGWEVQPSGGTSATKMGYVRQKIKLEDAGGTEIVAAKDVPDIRNKWVYVCVTWDHTTSKDSVKSYMNGALLNTSGNKTTHVEDSNYGMMIGLYGTRGNPWTGRYDELRLYNGVMSADRVKTDYDTMETPAEFFTLSPVKHGIIIIVH